MGGGLYVSGLSVCRSCRGSRGSGGGQGAGSAPELRGLVNNSASPGALPCPNYDLAGHMDRWMPRLRGDDAHRTAETARVILEGGGHRRAKARLRPCPGCSVRRDRIDLGPTLPNVARPHQSSVVSVHCPPEPPRSDLGGRVLHHGTPFLHHLTAESSLFEPGRPVVSFAGSLRRGSVLRSCLSCSRGRGRTDVGILPVAWTRGGG